MKDVLERAWQIRGMKLPEGNQDWEINEGKADWHRILRVNIELMEKSRGIEVRYPARLIFKYENTYEKGRESGKGRVKTIMCMCI